MAVPFGDLTYKKLYSEGLSILSIPKKISVGILHGKAKKKD
jgi:hypothetical protein